MLVCLIQHTFLKKKKIVRYKCENYVLKLYSKILLLGPLKIKMSSELKTLFGRPKLFLLCFLCLMSLFDQKWSLRPLLGCVKGGLNKLILLYNFWAKTLKEVSVMHRGKHMFWVLLRIAAL